MAVTGPGPYRMGMTCGTAQFLTAAMTCGMLGCQSGSKKLEVALGLRPYVTV